VGVSIAADLVTEAVRVEHSAAIEVENLSASCRVRLDDPH